MAYYSLWANLSRRVMLVLVSCSMSASASNDDVDNVDSPSPVAATQESEGASLSWVLRLGRGLTTASKCFRFQGSSGVTKQGSRCEDGRPAGCICCFFKEPSRFKFRSQALPYHTSVLPQMNVRDSALILAVSRPAMTSTWPPFSSERCIVQHSLEPVDFCKELGR